MAWRRRTYRVVDDERVDGICHQVFVRSGDLYFLTDLVVYADGAVECGGSDLIDVPRLERRLRTGAVLATPPEGARVSISYTMEWRATDLRVYLDADMLLADVADALDCLNQRPDSHGRCLRTLRTYLGDPTDDNRLALRERYLGIPQHRRRSRLHALDSKLRVLISDIGTPWYGDRQERLVTAEMHDEALTYLREQQEADHERQNPPDPADGPVNRQSPPISVFNPLHPHSWPDEQAIQGGLYNDFPAPITLNDRTYPTVTHAYWALSTDDPHWHDRIAAEPDPRTATQLGHRAPRRDGWPDARLAVMSTLLRAKYQQHPQLARNLVATDDAHLVATVFDAPYWTYPNNWLGRLLEVIRSELAATQAGLPLFPPHNGPAPTEK
jgi:predicted NAD-dependent protein-ADP-ribosyltransferase YbiA (DUF1768 family)